MGVTTDQPAVPYQPPAPPPGGTPSGIASQNDIRAQANQAKQGVSNRQQNFLAMVRANTPQSAESKFASAAANLSLNQDVVDKFVDWVLFG